MKLGELLDTVHVGDARVVCQSLPQDSINVTITSPPYFDLKDYGRPNQIGFGQDYEQYLADLALVFQAVYHATKQDGSLWLIVDTFRKGQEVLPLPFDIAARLKSVGWMLRDIIIWKKERTVPWTTSGGTRKIFEYILVFAKGSGPFRHDADSFRDTTNLKRWWVRYPERYNPRGKAPEEIWSYDIPTQGSWGDNYIRHFCPLPSELVARIVQTTTKPNDVVFDPFAGSGTVPTVSHLLSRSFIGVELNREYVQMFHRHIAKEKTRTAQQSLPLEAGNKASNFESTIVALRILKFGRLISRAILKALPGSTIQVYVYQLSSTPREKFKHYAAEYLIALDAEKQAKQVRELVESISQKAPLSKFGIQPTFNLVSSPNDVAASRRKMPHFRYSSTNSHSNSGRLTFADAWSSAGPLFSPIEVNVEEPDA